MLIDIGTAEFCPILHSHSHLYVNILLTFIYINSDLENICPKKFEKLSAPPRSSCFIALSVTVNVE